MEDRGIPLKSFLETLKKNENYSTQRREIARGFQQAVREMHTQNIVHRDLNPNNILIKTNPLEVSLIDFEYQQKMKDSVKTDKGGTIQKGKWN